MADTNKPRNGKRPCSRVRAGSAAEGQLRMTQEAAREFEAAGRRMAGATEGATGDGSRLMAVPSAAEGGVRDLQRSMAGLVEGVVRTNLRVAQEVFLMSNPAAVVELQQRFACEYTDTLMQNGATLVRAMRRTADETLRPLEEQIRQREQGGQRFQNAAE